MKDNFYNNNILLITPEDINFKSEGIDYMYGSLKSLFVEITKKTMNEGTFYKKILIINDKSLYSDSSKVTSTIDLIQSKALGLKEIFFTDVVHDGEPQNCSVNDSVVLCNTWSFPFVCNSYRRSNKLYEDCYSHRLTLKILDKL